MKNLIKQKNWKIFNNYKSCVENIYICKQIYYMYNKNIKYIYF